MIDLTSTAGLAQFLRELERKMSHHAKYAKPIVPPLLCAVLRHADKETMRQWGGGQLKGAILIFKHNGHKFRIKGDRIRQQLVMLDAGKEEVATFDVFDDIPAKFKATLKRHARRAIEDS